MYRCANIFLTDIYSVIWGSAENKSLFHHTQRYSVLFSQGTQGVGTQVSSPVCIPWVFYNACPVLANAVIIRRNTAEMEVHSIQLCQLVSKKKKRKRGEKKKKKI